MLATVYIKYKLYYGVYDVVAYNISNKKFLII